MSRSVYLIFLIALALVLGGRILNWFIDLSPEIERLLDIALFSLVGILYLGFAWAADGRYIKILFALGGVYLLVYPWIPSSNDLLGLLAIVIVILPLILGKFNPSYFK